MSSFDDEEENERKLNRRRLASVLPAKASAVTVIDSDEDVEFINHKKEQGAPHPHVTFSEAWFSYFHTSRCFGAEAATRKRKRNAVVNPPRPPRDLEVPSSDDEIVHVATEPPKRMFCGVAIIQH